MLKPMVWFGSSKEDSETVMSPSSDILVGKHSSRKKLLGKLMVGEGQEE